MSSHGPTLRKRRALGQHYLKDRTVIDRVVSRTLQMAREQECRHLIEIGPGRGALTDGLLAGWRSIPTLERFTIIEKDRELAAYWHKTLEQKEGVRVICADFLEV